MRKLYAVFVAILLVHFFVGTVNGQIRKKGNKPYLGILVGGTLSNISNYDAENRLGFAVGVYAQYDLSEKFSLLTNVSYAQRGAMSNDNNVSIKLDYLTFPFMFQYNLSDKIGISTGIAWDDLLTFKAEGLERSDFRESDWRVPFGFGYSISQNIKLGIAYSIGLTDITKNDNEKLRNNWGSIAIVYVFKKKEK